MKILICGQQLMLAEALAAALDARGYDVLAVTTTIGDPRDGVADYVPDVCLLGLQAGHQLSGPDTVRTILRRYPGTKVLVLSEATAPEMLSQLIKIGVAGLIHQDRNVAQIAETLDAIEAGQNVLDPGPMKVPARDTNRASQSRTVDSARPASRATGRYPSPAALPASAAQITATPSARRSRQLTGSSTCVTPHPPHRDRRAPLAAGPGGWSACRRARWPAR